MCAEKKERSTTICLFKLHWQSCIIDIFIYDLAYYYVLVFEQLGNRGGLTKSFLYIFNNWRHHCGRDSVFFPYINMKSTQNSILNLLDHNSLVILTPLELSLCLLQMDLDKTCNFKILYPNHNCNFVILFYCVFLLGRRV